MKSNRALEVLACLRTSEGKAVSGEALGGVLGISRAAVAKHIRNLENAGFTIDHKHARGYRLRAEPYLLNEFWLPSAGFTDFFRDYSYFPELPSTQDKVKELALKGAPGGTLIAAGRQTMGRGRLGRAWESPPGGLWFSFLLRPELGVEKAGALPLVTAYSALEALTDPELDVRLKWPNDILLNGRKAGGVIAESETEGDRINWIVIGVGLNLNLSKEALAGLPGAASFLAETGAPVSHEGFLDGFAVCFKKNFAQVGTPRQSALMHKVEEKLLYLGEVITVQVRERKVSGILRGLLDNGEALIEPASGAVITCSSGIIVNG